MHIKQVWCAALILTACLWAGWATPAMAQLFGINPTPAQAPAATAPAAAPDKPLVLKKYTKRRSRSAKHRKAHHAAKPAAAKAAADKTSSDKASTDKASADKPANDKQQAKDDDARDATGAAHADAKPDNTRPDRKSDPMKPEVATSGAPQVPSPVWSAVPSSVANARAELGGGTADANAVFTNKPTMPAQAVPPSPAPATSPQTTGMASAAVATPATAPTAAKTMQAEPTLASADAAEPVRLMSAMVQSEETASSDDSTWSRTSLIGKIFVAFGGLLMLASAARLYIG